MRSWGSLANGGAKLILNGFLKERSPCRETRRLSFSSDRTAVCVSTKSWCPQSSPVVSVQVLVGEGGEVGRHRTGDDEDKERDQVQSGHD